MELKDDDSLHSISAVFLGPKGWTFPWQARYVCYVIGSMILIGSLIIEHKLGLSFTITQFVWTLGGTIGLTMFIGRYIDYERPARTVWTTVLNELLSPHPRERRGTTVRLRRIK